MDELDRKLLDLLAANARTPAAELARRLGLSRTTVQSRVERLERTGVIAGYGLRLGEGVDPKIEAYVMITVSNSKAAPAANAIAKIPAVRVLRSVSGPFDLMATLSASTVAEIDAAIDGIGAATGVERTTSSIVLSTKIRR